MKKLLEALEMPSEGISPLHEGEPSEPVDEEKIRKLFQGDLHGAEAMEVAYMLSHERSWFEASIKVLLSRNLDIPKDLRNEGVE